MASSPARTDGLKAGIRWSAILLGSGFISAIGMAALARGIIPGISLAASSSIILLVQWQVLVLTCAKMGLDQAIFAAVTASPSIHLSIRRHLLVRALPIGMIFFFVLARIFDPFSAAACTASALIDTEAVSRASELAARRRFSAVTVGNLLNYPVFILLLVLSHDSDRRALRVAACCFLASSILRWLWIMSRRDERAHVTSEPAVASLGLGLQQGLNYLLFRGDQVAMPVAARWLFLPYSTASLSGYLFLARLPELFSSALVTVGPVVLPTLHRRIFQPDSVSARRETLIASGAAIITVAALAVGGFWIVSERPTNWALLVAFAAAAMLALPANLITYSLLRAQQLSDIIRSLVIAVSFGLAAQTVALLIGSPSVFAISVPVALATYIAFGSRRIDGKIAQ
jgi:hypothetical protein